MIGGVLGWLADSRWSLAAAKWGAVGLTVLLFLLSVRRAGERAGRMAQRLDTMEKAKTCSAGCWRRQLASLALVTSWLGGCAADGSELAVVAVCLPVVEYSDELRERAADELELLPEGAAIVEMPGDYAVMREQGRAAQK